MATTVTLNRDWVLTCNGVPIGPKGRKNWKLTPSATSVDIADDSSAGREDSMIVTRGDVVVVTGNRLEDASTGERDPGQAEVEALAKEVGLASRGAFVLTSPGGNSLTFTATAKMQEIGGDGNENTSWGVELNICGTPVEA